MRTFIKLIVGAVCFTLSTNSYAQKSSEMNEVINRGLSVAVAHSKAMAANLIDKEGRLPRSINKDGALTTSDSRWWTSGFFPGQLWYAYEATKDESLKHYAETFTDRIKREQYTTDNHDVGFMLYCSYGNGLRLTGNKEYEKVLLQGAQSLDTRFRPTVGCIRSWDWNQDIWEYPVIIDNMMNLELLTWASKASGNVVYKKHAISHADVTLKHQFRNDYSCYHVVSYDTITGKPHRKQTEQGYADESSWARGQAWALYGYTMMYRETKKEIYLEQATHIANFIINHPNLPEDKIPYWDFDAPNLPSALRDASAAAIMASAFIELSLYTPKKMANECIAIAEKQLKELTSPAYLAELGTNNNFILKHSVGNMPHQKEIDVPLSYTDYYFVEALIRYKNRLNKIAQY